MYKSEKRSSFKSCSGLGHLSVEPFWFVGRAPRLTTLDNLLRSKF